MQIAGTPEPPSARLREPANLSNAARSCASNEPSPVSFDTQSIISCAHTIDKAMSNGHETMGTRPKHTPSPAPDRPGQPRSRDASRADLQAPSRPPSPSRRPRSSVRSVWCLRGCLRRGLTRWWHGFFPPRALARAACPRAAPTRPRRRPPLRRPPSLSRSRRSVRSVRCLSAASQGDGTGFLRVLQSATRTTGPGQHWGSGYSRAPGRCAQAPRRPQPLGQYAPATNRHVLFWFWTPTASAVLNAVGRSPSFRRLGRIAGTEPSR